MILELAQSEAGQPFAEAVTEFDAPDYNKWVRKPMHLSLVASKLQDSQYVSIGTINAFTFKPSIKTRRYSTVQEHAGAQCKHVKSSLSFPWAALHACTCGDYLVVKNHHAKAYLG